MKITPKQIPIRIRAIPATNDDMLSVNQSTFDQALPWRHVRG